MLFQLTSFLCFFSFISKSKTLLIVKGIAHKTLENRTLVICVMHVQLSLLVIISNQHA